MATKLYVGNLSFHVTTPELEALFGQVGTVASATIMTDTFSGQPRGFGFVEMDREGEAQAAIERFHRYKLHGRALTVSRATPQEHRAMRRRTTAGGRCGRNRRPVANFPNTPF
jgi:RNA recognition motif-containing protein